jgi:hypothetical protein
LARAEAFFHLTANFNYPLISSSVLMFPAMVIRA